MAAVAVVMVGYSVNICPAEMNGAMRKYRIEMMKNPRRVAQFT
jgi:hypothetical protein